MAVLIGIAGAAAFFKTLEPRLRREMVRFLEEKFDAQVELENLQISLVPSPKISGHGLKLWKKGNRKMPPLVSVKEFSATARLAQLLKTPVTIDELSLVGLEILIPPKRSRSLEDPAATGKPQTQAAAPSSSSRQIKNPFSIVVDRIQADGAILIVFPRDPWKDPLVFDLYKLTVTSASVNQPLEFVATLKNAKPTGYIQTRGRFGPWNTPEPGQSPVSGEYTFRDADLSDFRGIRGKLFSTGTYQGVLERLEVNGKTDTPDFGLTTSDHALPLKTEFYAIVDGTNGDTFLKPVTAHLGETTFVCDGGIYKKEGTSGKTIELDVKLDRGRVEDLLLLVVPGNPVLTGAIRFHAALELPPGDEDVVRKLRLKGTFKIDHAEFTTAGVQDRIEKLSLRSRGRHEDKTNERIVSDLNGAFVLRSGTASFSNLIFLVPGARVNLQGTYGMVSEKIDFRGTLQMQAKLSQTQTGIKSILLKVVDPFFRKGTKGTVLPIKVSGTPKNASFGLNLGGK